MTTNRKDADYQIHSADARADLLRRAEAQGVKPFASLDDVVGDPETVTDFDVDTFLQQVREDRDRQSGGVRVSETCSRTLPTGFHYPGSDCIAR